MPGLDQETTRSGLLLKQFLSYTPRHVGNRVVRTGRAYPARGEQLRGTLVFADVSGFTAMSERLAAFGKEGAEILTQILNRYFARMLDDLVLPAGGDLFKFGGDAMTLFFAARSVSESALDHSAHVGVHTAVAMQEAMLEFAEFPTTHGVFNLKMSIGCSAGPVFGACLGDPAIGREFVLAGAGVEACAQAESAANATQVFVTPSTWERIANVAEKGEERDGGIEVLRFRRAPRAPRKQPAILRNPEALDAVVAEARRFLPPGIAPKIEADPESPHIDSEHREITVLFLNFWGVRYDEDPQAFVRLNGFYTAMQRIADRFGGVVNKMDMYTHGDKLMVLFGTPIAGDDPQQAVQCALDMVEENQR